MKRTLFFDTETTGLDKNAEVLEFCLTDQTGEPLLHERCSPVHVEEWPHAMAINHISPSAVRGLPHFSHFHDGLLEAVRGAELVIYNSAYDLQFLPSLVNHAAAVRCCMRRFSDWFQEESSRGLAGWRYQSLFTASMYSGYKWHGKSHTSLEDCRATQHVWEWLILNEGTPRQEPKYAPESCKLHISGGS